MNKTGRQTLDDGKDDERGEGEEDTIADEGDGN